MNHWLVIGIKKNWITALSQPVPIWGLKQQYTLPFQSVKEGDNLWLYVTSPVKGIIGIGKVKDRYVDTKTLIWPEELEKKYVVWPLRFRIHILKILPIEEWERSSIRINDFNLFWQQGFQNVPSNLLPELLKRAEKVFGSFESLYEGSSIIQTPEMVPSIGIKESDSKTVPVVTTPIVSPHLELQNYLAEVGKLQNYYSELEYPLELELERKSIDVVWKREINGAPTFAFEIEFSNNIEKAVERLKFAFRKWNSRPRIIIPETALSRLHNILSNSERDFSTQFRNYRPEQIKELLNKKRDLKAMEQDLGLY
ncbi:MAG: hypothetical protein N3D17_02015 [bacterium]|nr:hypothetical protein [bacterium]